MAAGYLVRSLATGRDLPKSAQHVMDLWRGFIEEQAGGTLEIQPPRNDFALHAHEGVAVLIAGGIGITPLVSMAARLRAQLMPVRLHYAVSPAVLAPKCLYVTRATLFAHIAVRARCQAMADELFDVVRSGQVKIHIDQRFPLHEVRAAHRALEARQTTGSTILTL